VQEGERRQEFKKWCLVLSGVFTHEFATESSEKYALFAPSALSHHLFLTAIFLNI
jgi:hypothetical protein